MGFPKCFPISPGWVIALTGILPFPPSCRFPKAETGAVGCFPSLFPAGTWGKLQLLTHNPHRWRERDQEDRKP